MCRTDKKFPSNTDLLFLIFHVRREYFNEFSIRLNKYGDIRS